MYGHAHQSSSTPHVTVILLDIAIEAPSQRQRKHSMLQLSELHGGNSGAFGGDKIAPLWLLRGLASTALQRHRATLPWAAAAQPRGEAVRPGTTRITRETQIGVARSALRHYYMQRMQSCQVSRKVAPLRSLRRCFHRNADSRAPDPNVRARRDFAEA